MGTISYIAVDRGRLTAGHSEGTSYTIEVDFELHDDSSDRKVSEPVSLSGKRFTLFHRKDIFESFSTLWVDDLARQLQMKELADSLDAGEEFVVDPYGTIAVPVEPITGHLKGVIKKQRYKKMERFKYNFSIYNHLA